MLSQIALGHNRYGAYLVVVLTILLWIGVGPHGDRNNHA